MKKLIILLILIMILSSISISNGINIQKNDNLFLQDSFSWKNHNGYDWTTPVQDQMKEGPCWAFAAISALESVIKIRENAP